MLHIYIFCVAREKKIADTGEQFRIREFSSERDTILAAFTTFSDTFTSESSGNFTKRKKFLKLWMCFMIIPRSIGFFTIF